MLIVSKYFDAISLDVLPNMVERQTSLQGMYDRFTLVKYSTTTLELAHDN